MTGLMSEQKRAGILSLFLSNSLLAGDHSANMPTIGLEPSPSTMMLIQRCGFLLEISTDSIDGINNREKTADRCNDLKNRCAREEDVVSSESVCATHCYC